MTTLPIDYDKIRLANIKEYGNVGWSREENLFTSSILIGPVLKSKGLERYVIILWVNQDAVIKDAVMYVGSSRAKSILYLVGDNNSLEHLN